MKGKIKKLREKRAKIVADQRALYDKAEKEERALNADEKTEFERLDADFESVSDEIRELEADLERREKVKTREAELDQVVDRRIVPQDRNDQRGAEYRGIYDKYLRMNKAGLDAAELRQLISGTDNKGGYLVPTEMHNLIIEGIADVNVMRAMATVLYTEADRELPVALTDGAAYWTAEAAAYTDDEGTFDQKTLSAYKCTRLARASEELVNDSAFDIQAYLMREFARTIGAKEENGFVVGTGSGQPTGVATTVAAGSNLVTAAANNAITADELIDTYHKLKPQYRKFANWLMNDATAKVIRKLKDGDDQYLWQPGLQAGQPDILFGRPVQISTHMATIASDALVICFGDFSYYYIGVRGGFYVQRLDELYAANGFIGFRGYERVDGILTLAEAVAGLEMAT